MSTAVVETEGLAKTYRDFIRRRPTEALAGVSLSVEPGAIFGLLGQNSAGKTTLVKILLGLVWPTAGRARVFGQDPGVPATRRRIGYLPEQMRLPEFMKAESFLRLMGRLNGMDGAALARRIPDALERVGLAGEKRPLRTYSKGMQQRLGLAQAMVHDPDLLFLDEPTEGLDPLGRKQIRDLLLELRNAGKTIFLNSHVLSEVEQICDRILILDRGQVVRAGTPREFTESTGEYRIRLSRLDDAARAAVAAVVPDAKWDTNGCRVRVRDVAQLNALIDRLRAAQAEIAAIEPLRVSLEEYFIQVVTAKES